MKEWMRHLYSALLCIVVHPKHFIIRGGLSSTTTSVRTTAPVLSPHTSYRWRGERVIEPIKWMRSPHTSYRWRGERVIEPIKCMLSPHTSYRWRGERDRANQVDGDYWEAMIDKGQWWAFVQDTRVTPLLFYEKCHGIFNDHRESGPRFNISSERQYFLTV